MIQITIDNRIQSQQFSSVSEESLHSPVPSEPLARMLAAVEDEEQAIAVLKLALRVDFRLAAKLAGAVKPAFQPQAVGLISRLEIPQPLKLHLLALTGSASAIPELASALKDKSASVRLRAVEALGALGSEAAVPALSEALQDKNLCRAAVEALGNLGGEEAAAALFETIARQTGEMRDFAAAALAKIDSDAALSFLASALTDEDAAIRSSAATALAQSASPAAIRALLWAAAAAECGIRATATAALSQIRAETAVPLLANALSNADCKVCQSLAAALGAIASEQAIPALIQTLTRSNLYARMAAADALGQIGSKDAIPHLIKALQDEAPGVRRRAAAALEHIGAEIPDDSPELPASAAVTFEKIDSIEPSAEVEHSDCQFSVLGDRIFAGMLAPLTKRKRWQPSLFANRKEAKYAEKRQQIKQRAARENLTATRNSPKEARRQVIASSSPKIPQSPNPGKKSHPPIFLSFQ